MYEPNSPSYPKVERFHHPLSYEMRRQERQGENQIRGDPQTPASKLWNIFSQMFMMPKTRASFSLTSEPVTEVGGCISPLGSLSNGSHIYPHQVPPHVHSWKKKV